MSAEPQLFRINPDSHESERIDEVEFASLGFQERRDIQEWIAANPGILGEDLLVIGKEFSGFDRTDERLDLLAVDADGRLVVIELKRDDTGSDAHWQAIKYASYLHRATADNVIPMLAEYAEVSESEATDWLLRHLNADDFNALNNDQRIILASHRFAPEVISAALWLNEKAPGEDLITCVQLTPYRDGEAGSLYVQANTIIPVPGVDEYVIGIGDASNEKLPVGHRVSKWVQTAARNRNDEVTRFLRDIADRTIQSLPGQLKPEKRSRWAGQSGDYRYYHLWYARPEWGNWDMFYFTNLYREDERDSGAWRIDLGFRGCQAVNAESWLANVNVHDDQLIDGEGNELLVSRRASALDASFADALATTLAHFIEVLTPRIDAILDESNEEGA